MCSAASPRSERLNETRRGLQLATASALVLSVGGAATKPEPKPAAPARGPKRAAADNPRGLSGEATKRERSASRGTRRVTGATHAGRPARPAEPRRCRRGQAAPAAFRPLRQTCQPPPGALQAVHTTLATSGIFSHQSHVATVVLVRLIFLREGPVTVLSHGKAKHHSPRRRMSHANVVGAISRAFRVGVRPYVLHRGQVNGRPGHWSTIHGRDDTLHRCVSITAN